MLADRGVDDGVAVDALSDNFEGVGAKHCGAHAPIVEYMSCTMDSASRPPCASGAYFLVIRISVPLRQGRASDGSSLVSLCMKESQGPLTVIFSQTSNRPFDKEIWCKLLSGVAVHLLT